MNDPKPVLRDKQTGWPIHIHPTRMPDGGLSLGSAQPCACGNKAFDMPPVREKPGVSFLFGRAQPFILDHEEEE